MTVTNGDWVNLHDTLAVTATPAALAAPLRAAHLPADQIKAIAPDLTNVDGLLPGTLPDEMDNVQELHTIDNLRDGSVDVVQGGQAPSDGDATELIAAHRKFERRTRLSHQERRSCRLSGPLEDGMSGTRAGRGSHGSRRSRSR